MDVDEALAIGDDAPTRNAGPRDRDALILLAAEVRRLRDRIDYLERSLHSQVEETGKAEAECRRLRAANAALVEALEDISSTPDALNQIGCTCQECGDLFKADILVSDEVWNAILPNRNGGGLLCGACLVRKIENLYGFSAWRLSRQD